MRRGPCAKVAARNVQLLERITAIKAEHPFWGCRRVWAYLRYADGLAVNPKRVYGLMKAADLLVRPNPKLRAKRKAETRKPRPTRPNEWWGIDMTKVMIEDFALGGNTRRPAERMIGSAEHASTWSSCWTGTPRRWSATMPACRRGRGTGWSLCTGR
jgi:hypothetical protein